LSINLNLKGKLTETGWQRNNHDHVVLKFA